VSDRQESALNAISEIHLSHGSVEDAVRR